MPPLFLSDSSLGALRGGGVLPYIQSSTPPGALREPEMQYQKVVDAIPRRVERVDHVHSRMDEAVEGTTSATLFAVYRLRARASLTTTREVVFDDRRCMAGEASHYWGT